MTYLETNFTKFILEKNMQNLNEENMKILLKNTNVDLNRWKWLIFSDFGKKIKPFIYLESKQVGSKNN